MIKGYFLMYIGFILAFLFWGCDTPFGKNLKPLAERRQKMQQEISARAREQIKNPLSDSSLFAYLPDNLEGYGTTRDRGGSFFSEGDSFSEAGRTYYGPKGSYLYIRIADYRADTSAFLAIWQNYIRVETESHSAWPVFKEKPFWGNPEAFAWTWKDKRRESTSLEAGLDFRFHVLLRSNEKRASKILPELFEKLIEKDFLREELP